MAQSNNNVILFKKDDKKHNSDDVWDDRALIRAYDRSISRIKNELNKKLETKQEKIIPNDLDLDEEEQEDEFFEENEFDQEKEGYYDEDEEDEADSIQFDENDLRKKDPENWCIDDLCMALYSQDGLLYPAKIIKIFDDDDKNRKKCLVKYLFYLNEEEKYLDELFELNEENKKKKLEDEQTSLENIKTENLPHNFQIPPPPLPDKLCNREDSPATEKDALHSMLLSWYMNGYHTGYYLGLTQNKKRIN